MTEPHTQSAPLPETPPVEPHDNTALVAQCVLIAKPDLITDNDRDFAQDDEVKLVVQRVEKFIFYLENRRQKFTKNLSNQASLEMKTAFEPFKLYLDAKEAVDFVELELKSYPGGTQNPPKMMKKLKDFLSKFEKQTNKRFLREMVRGNPDIIVEMPFHDYPDGECVATWLLDLYCNWCRLRKGHDDKYAFANLSLPPNRLTLARAKSCEAKSLGRIPKNERKSGQK